jgi:D-sedoheptulose 7-phosphate isomerase
MNERAVEIGAFSSEYLDQLRQCLDRLQPDRIAAVVALMLQTYERRSRVFIAGNGGSAATASHMACDLAKTVPGMTGEVRGFDVMSLSDNTSLLTAWANDAGFEKTFSEPLRAFAKPGDLFIVISASGRSANVLAALASARSAGVKAIGLFGFDGGPAASMVDEAIVVESTDYGIVEDVHLALNHIITGFFRQKLCGR